MRKCDYDFENTYLKKESMLSTSLRKSWKQFWQVKVSPANRISVQFWKRKSKGRYIFPSAPSKRYIYVHSMPRHEYQIGAAKLNIALVGRECGNFADATGIRLGRRNSTAHKWMRTVALFCRVRKVRLLCNTRWVVRTESFHCAIQESSKRLYHERLLCKAGSTKAALAVRVFVNRYLEMDSRAFFQWTEAEEGRSSTRVVLSCSQSTEIDFKAWRATVWTLWKFPVAMGVNKYFLLSLF